MSRIRVGQENSTPIEIAYEDHGSGPPVVLIHGYPLSGRSWEKTTIALLKAGYRVITYDRRGFGQSSQPVMGYDYDTFAADLDHLLIHLDLSDVALVGFSMGGGEVARYIGQCGTKRIKKAAFISAITPFLAVAEDNPKGLDDHAFAEIEQSVRADRLAFLTQFIANFYNVDQLLGHRVSEEIVRDAWITAAGASPIGTHDSVRAWGTDFRKDLARFDVPTLVIHGDQDRIVPVDLAGRRMREFVPHALYVEMPGAPHGLLTTHADEMNRTLLDFLGSDRTFNLESTQQAASRSST
jgi:pimeloyl-ACP methyl ester carboxylesterase